MIFRLLMRVARFINCLCGGEIMSDYECRNCGYESLEGGTTMHCCETVMKSTIETLESGSKTWEKLYHNFHVGYNEAKCDIEDLEYKVKELESLCMEFASLGRTSVNQNDSLKHLCESYSEIANRRHLTTNKTSS